MGGPVGAVAGGLMGGASSVAKAAKKSGKDEVGKQVVNLMGTSASDETYNMISKIFQDPLSFKQRIGLAAVSGGLGVLGDMIKENQGQKSAIRLKQTPANSPASVAAASIRPIGAGEPVASPYQSRINNLIAQAGSPQLKASRFGIGGF